jgi:hypothetical protein
MSTTTRAVDFSRSGPFFLGFLLIALTAFWPSYISQSFSASSSYTHFHAITATIWMLLLIVQPILIRTRRLPLHRVVGRASYVIAPIVVLSFLLLASNRIRIASAAAYPIQTYILYLQLTLAALFAFAYAAAIYSRRTVALHARFMVCTAITLIDPITIRLMFWAFPVPTWNYQWLTYGLTDAALLVLIWMERRSRSGRFVFPLMLALFVVVQIPALSGWTDSDIWQRFAAWFKSIPLT